MGHWRVASAVGVGIISQIAGCECQTKELVPKEGTRKLVITGPATVTAGQPVTFQLLDQVTGTPTCPEQALFTFVETNGGASTVSVSPTTGFSPGEPCHVTLAAADHAFVAGPAGTTRPAVVKVALTDPYLYVTHGTTTVQVTTPGGPGDGTATPSTSATATATATPIPDGSTPGFKPSTDYPVGDANPVAVDVGDYNGPAAGGLGAAVALDAGSSKDATVLVRGGSAFDTTNSYSLGVNFQPTDIAGADFNGDGIRDLVVSSNNTSTVAELDGTPAGVFTTPKALNGNYGQPQGIAVGDVNGDGKPDIATASPSLTGAGVGINTSAAGGPTSFSAPASFAGGPTAPGTESVPFGVALGDLDGDGKPDLVLADPNRDRLSALINTTPTGAATPTFSAYQMLADDAGRGPRDVAIADIGGDGKADIVVANYNRDSVSVFTNTTPAGSKTITTTEKSFPVGSAPQALAIMNADNNGKPDLAVADYGSGDASVLLNNEAGGFLARTRILTAESPEGIAVADVNGDHRDDLAVANNGEPAPHFRAGSLSVVLSFTGSRSAVRVPAAAAGPGTQIQTSGSLKLLKGTKLGAVAFDPDGTIHVKRSLLAGRMALKVAGKRLPGEPKGLRALLKADLRGTIDFDRLVLPSLANPVIGTGTLAGRSRKDKRVTACVRLSRFDAGGVPLQKLTLLGATGKAARLRLSALIAPVSLEATPAQTGSDRPVVTVSTGKARKLSPTCRKLVKQLP